MLTKAIAIRLQYTESGKAEIILSTDQSRIDISELKAIIAKGKELSVKIEQFRKGRSLDANAYCWVLCQKIAEAIGNVKEEVYRTFVKRVGPFVITPLKDEAVERYIEVWCSNGLGWQAESIGSCKRQGWQNVMAYFGSSAYNTKEMSVLINEIVSECKDMGIETLPESELARMKDEWGK